jgi:hypothetical protein
MNILVDYRGGRVSTEKRLHEDDHLRPTAVLLVNTTV